MIALRISRRDLLILLGMIALAASLFIVRPALALEPRGAGIAEVAAGCAPGASLEVTAHLRLNKDDLVEVQVIRGGTYTRSTIVWANPTGTYQYVKLNGVIPANAVPEGTLQVLVTVGSPDFKDKSYAEVATYKCNDGYPKGVGVPPLPDSFYTPVYPYPAYHVEAFRQSPIPGSKSLCSVFQVDWWGIKIVDPDLTPGCEKYRPDQLSVMCLQNAVWTVEEVKKGWVVGGTYWAWVTQHGACAVFPK